MDCSLDVSGALRAQEHGHQPLVYENHGLDARYTGPHEVAPTMSASYGTGGNNVPLVEQDSVLFSRKRVDVFKSDSVAATQSARQHKDATDLVYQKSVGALTTSDRKGINNQYVSQDKCVVENCRLIRRLTLWNANGCKAFPMVGRTSPPPRMPQGTRRWATASPFPAWTMSFTESRWRFSQSNQTNKMEKENSNAKSCTKRRPIAGR